MPDGMNNPTTEPDGSTSQPDGSVETLQKEIAALRARAEKAEAEAKANRERFEEEKAERDKRIEAARKKAEQDGEFEKLANEYKAELEKLKPISDENKALHARIEAIEKAQKESLLAELPDDQKAEWQDADIITLERIVKLVKTTQPNIPGTHTGAGAAKGGAKGWNDMTTSEQHEYVLSHPQEDVNRLIAESMKRRA